MESVTNLIRIKSNPKLNMTPEGDFFRAWVEFLKPVHNLSKKEMDVLAVYLKKRWELGKVITDQDTLDKVLMSREMRSEVREICHLSVKHLQVIISKFRRNGVVKDGRIFLNLIPSITKEGVGLMVYFSFGNEQHIKLGPQAGVQKP